MTSLFDTTSRGSPSASFSPELRHTMRSLIRMIAFMSCSMTTCEKPRPINQAECLACHKPLDNVSYTFTLKELSAAK